MIGSQANDVWAGEWAGSISSARLGDLPQNATFDVLVYDDSAENLRFRTSFLKALSLAGHALSEKPALMFSFNPEYITPVSRRAGRRARRYMRSGRRADLKPQYPLSYIRVGASADAWLIGAKNRWILRKDRRERSSPPGRLHLNVQLRDTRSRTVLWSADLYCDMLVSDRARLDRSIVAPIIGRIGQTTQPKSFAIR